MMQHCIHIRLVLYPLLIHKQQQQQACSTCPGSHGRAAQATYLGQNCRVLPVTDAQRQEASLDDMESGSVKTFSLFASASRDAGLQARLDDLPALSVDPLKCLLLGPPRRYAAECNHHSFPRLRAAAHHPEGVLHLCTPYPASCAAVARPALPSTMLINWQQQGRQCWCSAGEPRWRHSPSCCLRVYQQAS